MSTDLAQTVITDREGGDIQYTFILSINHLWRIEYIIIL